MIELEENKKILYYLNNKLIIVGDSLCHKNM